MTGTLVVLLLMLLWVIAARALPHLAKRACVWYLRRCRGAFHWGAYGDSGRYVVLLNERQYHEAMRRPFQGTGTDAETTTHPPFWTRPRWSEPVALALLSVFLALPLAAQDPQSVPVPPAVEPSPEPTPKPKQWEASFDGGAASVSVPEDGVKGYASLRATLVGEPSWVNLRLIAQARADRTANGAALSIEAFKSFRSIEAGLGALYRIRNSPVSVLGVGSLSWNVESDIKGLSDPNLWSFGAGACIERFKLWPNGGIACLAGGRWSGKDGIRFDLTQPLDGSADGKVLLAVESTVAFKKLPDLIRAVPSALQAAPLTTQPLGQEQIVGIAQRLPVTVKVSVLVRPWAKKF